MPNTIIIVGAGFSGTVLAANEQLHPQLLKLLKTATASAKTETASES